MSSVLLFQHRMGGTRSIVRGSSGLGWLLSPDRWMVWLEDGAHALLSVERGPESCRVRVDLVRPRHSVFVDVHLPASAPDLDAAILEAVVEAAVGGDLPFSPAYRSAWAIAVRSTAEGLQSRRRSAWLQRGGEPFARASAPRTPNKVE